MVGYRTNSGSYPKVALQPHTRFSQPCHCTLPQPPSNLLQCWMDPVRGSCRHAEGWLGQPRLMSWWQVHLQAQSLSL